MMNNWKIKTEANKKRVYLWEVADALGISEPTLTRRLRRELSDQERDQIIKIIDQIAKERE